MATKYLLVQFLLPLITLMALRTALGEQNWVQHAEDLPIGFGMMDDGDDGGGELCDPGKSNACESPTAQCVWKQLDMLYKCTEPRNNTKKRLVKRKRFKSDDKKNGTRKRMVKGFGLPNTHRESGGITSHDLRKINPFHKGGKLFRNEESPPDAGTPSDLLEGRITWNDEANTDRFPDWNAETTENHQEWRTEQPMLRRETTESHSNDQWSATGHTGATATQSVAIFHDPWKGRARARGRQEQVVAVPQNADIKKKPVGTLVVPKYYGDMTWDGKTIFSETCILKSVMAEALEERKSLESKTQWVEDNRDQICNFRRFFHCTIEQADSELVLDDGEEEELPTEPVCRCYESAMPVVNGMCYIPADFGAKSACGDHVTAPYPIQPWKRAPTLKPRCTPNSDCKESQYWFGKRCTCRYNARWNPQTHVCDKGIRLTVSLGLLIVSYAIICLKS